MQLKVIIFTDISGTVGSFSGRRLYVKVWYSYTSNLECKKMLYLPVNRLPIDETSGSKNIEDNGKITN